MKWRLVVNDLLEQMNDLLDFTLHAASENASSGRVKGEFTALVPGQRNLSKAFGAVEYLPLPGFVLVDP